VQNHCIIREKGVTFIGGFAFLTSTRSSAPGPRWGPTAAPRPLPIVFFVHVIPLTRNSSIRASGLRNQWLRHTAPFTLSTYVLITGKHSDTKLLSFCRECNLDNIIIILCVYAYLGTVYYLSYSFLRCIGLMSKTY
jgi:hypothetical protein